MKKSFLFLLLLLLLTISAFADKNPMKSDILRLDYALSQRPNYDQQKRHRIDSLTLLLDTAKTPYAIYKCLYEEYKSFNYDTALIFTQNMYDEAILMQQPDLLAEVNLSRAFVYLSGGLFKEAYDLLSHPTPYFTCT